MNKLIWVVSGDHDGVLGVTTSRKKAEKICLDYVTRDMQDDGYSVADIQDSIGLQRFDKHTAYASTRTRVEASCTGYTMGEF